MDVLPVVYVFNYARRDASANLWRCSPTNSAASFFWTTRLSKIDSS